MNTTKPTTETKHTPGPWKYHLGNGANPRFHIQTEGSYQIASTPELNKHRMAAEENAGKEANARLIASAPELLAALDALMNATDGLMDLYEDDSRAEAYADDLKATSAARDLARAAIAKAERGA
jgi:hypothetical protein